MLVVTTMLICLVACANDLEGTTEPEVNDCQLIGSRDVLWVEDENVDRTETSDFPPGTVIVGEKLQDTILSANDDDLIAFIVEPIRGQMYFDFAIKIDELVICEDLDPDGTLQDMIRNFCESSSWEDYQEIREYILAFELERAEPIYAELYEIRNQIFYDLKLNHGCISDNILEWDEWDVLWDEALVLALQDTKYKENYDLYNYYVSIVQNFWYSWEAQQIVGLRNKMIEFGFAPVYSLDEVNRAKYPELPYIPSGYKEPQESPIARFESLMLLFAGTSEQIHRFAADVAATKTNSYYLWGSSSLERYFVAEIS